MIDQRVIALCEEFGIEVLESTSYPKLGQTRAHGTIRNMIDNLGEDHARMVLMTLAETANNKALLDEVGLWMASDMVKIFRKEIDADPTAWFETWDKMPIGFLQSRAHELRGAVKPRFALGGMVYLMLRQVFGQPELVEI
jgi:hypothetical protein